VIIAKRLIEQADERLGWSTGKEVELHIPEITRHSQGRGLAERHRTPRVMVPNGVAIYLPFDGKLPKMLGGILSVFASIQAPIGL
jgi:hypothetical protein